MFEDCGEEYVVPFLLIHLYSNSFESNLRIELFQHNEAIKFSGLLFWTTQYNKPENSH